MSLFANCRSRAICAGLLAASLLSGAPCGAVQAAPAERIETFDFKYWALQRFTIPREHRPALSYYLSTPGLPSSSMTRSPLVLLIQGSGCIAPFNGLGTDHRSSSIFPFVGLARSGKYAVMAVDKPYQPAGRQDSQPNGAIDCGAAFNGYYAYDTWLAALRQALQHALTRPGVDPGRVLVVGMSEGGVLAAGLARAMPEIKAVALIGTSGTTQLYDFIAAIHAGNGSDADKLHQLQALDATLKQIMADPSSSTKMAWGHPYRRWSSFMAQSAADNLQQSRARVYIASGMQDKSVPILSTEVMVAQLRAQGRDVTVRRVAGANHDLTGADGGFEQVQQEYDAIIRWFEGP